MRPRRNTLCHVAEETDRAFPPAGRAGEGCAVVVLGARVLGDGRPSPALERRVLHGVALARRHPAARLLLSGGATGGPLDEAWVMATLALGAGIAAERLILEDRALDTLGNARHSLPLLRAARIGRVLLVTDPSHMPRALLSFRAVAGDHLRLRAAPTPCPAGGWRNRRAIFGVLREMAALGLVLPRLLIARRFRQ
ncbi:MAG TPA: YdcF family protein, partial [Rhodospirillum rubrum]|nr:YdcF family protein [Rhodospirillum rubrum]